MWGSLRKWQHVGSLRKWQHVRFTEYVATSEIRRGNGNICGSLRSCQHIGFTEDMATRGVH